MVYRQKGEFQNLRLQKIKACKNHLFCDSPFCLITGNICSNAIDVVLEKIQIDWESHLIPSLSVILVNILWICSSPPTKFLKIGGVAGFQFLEERSWERWGDFFRRVEVAVFL